MTKNYDDQRAKWGDFRTMSREDLLLTKADIEASLFRTKEQIAEVGQEPSVELSRLLRKKRIIQTDYQRCNVYIGVSTLKAKSKESLAANFYKVAKEQLDDATFQALLERAKTVGASTSVAIAL